MALRSFPRPRMAGRLLSRCTHGLVALLGVSMPFLAVPADRIAVGAEADGRIEVFFAAQEGGVRLFHTWQLQRNAQFPSNIGAWAQWEDFYRGAGSISGITLAPDGSLRLAVGMVASGSIWSAHQDAPNGAFAGWSFLDTHDLNSIVSATNVDGRIEFLTLSNSGGAWTTYQTAPGVWQWANQSLDGTELKVLVASPYRDGRLGAIAVGGDGRAYFTSQIGPGLDWGPWSTLDGNGLVDISVRNNAAGGLHVVALGGDGSLYENVLNAPLGFTAPGVERRIGFYAHPGPWTWSGWRFVAPGPFASPLKLLSNADGRLELFLLQERKVVHLWQTAPSPMGAWVSAGQALGGISDGFDVAKLTDGRLAMVSFRTSASTSGHGETAFAAFSQDSPNSAWRESAAPGTLYTPPPPPFAIAFQQFEAKPDYVDQGGASKLVGTLAPSGGCIPANLSVYKTDYGLPEIQILAQPAPGTSGSFGIAAAPAISSPIHYRADVECKGRPDIRNGAKAELAFSPVHQTIPATMAYFGPVLAPALAVEKKPFSLTWTVQNVGEASSSTQKVQLYLDNVSEGDAKEIPALTSGQTSVLVWSITKSVTGYQHTAELRDDKGSRGFGQFTLEAAPPEPGPSPDTGTNPEPIRGPQ